MATAVQVVQPKRAAVTERKRRRFLDLLRDGVPVSRAAEKAKIPRQTAYDWRRADPGFAKAWEDAWEQGADVLEEVVQDRALDRNDPQSYLLLMFALKARRPDRYRDNVRHQVDAHVTVAVEDARAELASRIGMIEDHRARAIEGTARELPPASSPRTDVA